MSENEWWQTEENDSVATKPELWRPLSDAIGGFDLDPAAGCEPTPIATDRYTEADDGLSQPWYGTVWLNPPFSKKHAFFKRLFNHFNNREVERAVAIAPCGVDTEWFQKWFSTANVICFLDGRDWYIHGNNNPNFATMVGVWNPTTEVVKLLESLGTVVSPHQDTAQQTL